MLILSSALTDDFKGRTFICNVLLLHSCIGAFVFVKDPNKSSITDKCHAFILFIHLHCFNVNEQACL